MPEPDLRLLTMLRRLRRVETDGARRGLGEALVEEMTLAAQYETMQRDLSGARAMSGDFDREAFAAWFGRMRIAQAQLTDAMRQAEARTAAARGTLARRRLAETAAEEALAGELAARSAELARRDQLTLEDVARSGQRAAAARRPPRPANEAF